MGEDKLAIGHKVMDNVTIGTFGVFLLGLSFYWFSMHQSLGTLQS